MAMIAHNLKGNRA